MTDKQFSDWVKDNLSIEQISAIITYANYKRNPDGYCDSIDSFLDKLRLRPRSLPMDISLFTKYMRGIPDTDKISKECRLIGYELDSSGIFLENGLYRIHASKYDDEIVDIFAVTDEGLISTLVHRAWKSGSNLIEYDDPMELIEAFMRNTGR